MEEGGSMKTIVLGYDDTDPSKRALERAAELANAFGSQVIVTSVAGLMAPAPRGGGIDPLQSPQVRREDLDAAVAALAAKGVEAKTVLAVGDPADAIVGVAAENNADLIVVGTREHSFLGRIFGQSVSEGVTRQASCDVLVVR